MPEEDFNDLETFKRIIGPLSKRLSENQLHQLQADLYRLAKLLLAYLRENPISPNRKTEGGFDRDSQKT